VRVPSKIEIAEFVQYFGNLGGHEQCRCRTLVCKCAEDIPSYMLMMCTNSGRM